MIKTLAVERGRKEQVNIIYQDVTRDGEYSIANIVQFTVKSARGRKTEVEIDFKKQTVTPKNKLFKVVASAFSVNKFKE